MRHRAERFEQGGVEVLIDGDAAGAVREGEYAIVRRRLAVNRDGVERVARRFGQRPLQHHRIDRRIRRRVFQHRRHARLDHSRAFRHPADAESSKLGRDFDRVFLRKRIGRHDRPRGRGTAVRRQRRHRLRNAAADSSILRLTPITPVDATSTWSSRQPIAVAGELRHLLRIDHALRTSAGVGAAAIGHDRARAAVARSQVILAEIQRRRLGEIYGEHTRRARRRIADDQGEVGLAARLDAAMQAAGPESGWRGHAAINRPEVDIGRRRPFSGRSSEFDERSTFEISSTTAYDRNCGTAGTDAVVRDFFGHPGVRHDREAAAHEERRIVRECAQPGVAVARARAARSSTIRRPSPRRRTSRLTTSERTSATACDSGASSAHPTMRSAGEEVSTATTNRGA